MCPSNCVILYQPDIPLDKITCPCGYGYWDVLRAQFVYGTDVREGKADTKEAYEARLKNIIPDPQERDAKLRKQLESHLSGCESQRTPNTGPAGRLSAPDPSVTDLQAGASSTQLPLRTPGAAQRRASREPTKARQPGASRKITTSPPDEEDDTHPVALTRQDRPLGSIASRQATSDRPTPAYPVERSQSLYPSSPTKPSSGSRMTYATQQSSGQSDELSPLLMKFIQFGETQWASLVTFCENNTEVLEEDPRPLQRAVLRYLRDGNLQLAQQTAHRLVLLGLCVRRPSGERLGYLRSLADSEEERESIGEAISKLIRQSKQ